MVPVLRGFVVIALVAVCAPSVSASEEDYLPWQSVQINCFESPETGKVGVSAQAGPQGLREFTIAAFGKSYALSKSDLLKIKDYPLDSLRVTHEAGYARSGGHAVHVKLRRNYQDDAKKSVTEEAYASVTEEKGLAVSTRVKRP